MKENTVPKTMPETVPETMPETMPETVLQFELLHETPENLPLETRMQVFVLAQREFAGIPFSCENEKDNQKLILMVSGEYAETKKELFYETFLQTTGFYTCSQVTEFVKRQKDIATISFFDKKIETIFKLFQKKEYVKDTTANGLLVIRPKKHKDIYCRFDVFLSLYRICKRLDMRKSRAKKEAKALEEKANNLCNDIISAYKAENKGIFLYCQSVLNDTIKEIRAFNESPKCNYVTIPMNTLWETLSNIIWETVQGFILENETQIKTISPIIESNEKPSIDEIIGEIIIYESMIKPKDDSLELKQKREYIKELLRRLQQ